MANDSRVNLKMVFEIVTDIYESEVASEQRLSQSHDWEVVDKEAARHYWDIYP